MTPARTVRRPGGASCRPDGHPRVGGWNRVAGCGLPTEHLEGQAGHPRLGVQQGLRHQASRGCPATGCPASRHEAPGRLGRPRAGSRPRAG